jgi:hypothetical protein
VKNELIDPSLPITLVDFKLNNHSCNELKDSREYINHLFGTGEGKRRYISVEQPYEGQIPVASLDVRDLTFEDYLKLIKKRDSKQSVLRNARKADKIGAVCKPFVRSVYVPDIVAINLSKDIRSCGPMSPSYRHSVEEMGGEPTQYKEFKYPDCPYHYGIFWGLFVPEPGYKQGNVTTNEKLLAYIRIRRFGNFATYSMILGHGDYLKYGIMYRLHLEIMKWICSEGNSYSQGLKCLTYAGYYDGDEGLTMWKKKTCFAPSYLAIPSELMK